MFYYKIFLIFTLFSRNVRTTDANEICGESPFLSSNSDNSGQNQSINQISKRIIGGHTAPKRLFPWQAGIKDCYNSKTCKILCGGSLISDIWVLTAGHCIKPYRNKPLYVLLGHTDHDNYEEEGGKIFKVAEKFFYNNPEKNERLQEIFLDNDLGMIRLREKVVFSEHIKPICLLRNDKSVFKQVEKCQYSFGSVDFYISGWGITDYQIYRGKARRAIKSGTKPGSFYPKSLHYTTVNLVKTSTCEKWLSYQAQDNQRNVGENSFCAGVENGGQDACINDSGGPLVYRDPITGRFSLIGIISWGIGCGQEMSPGVYVRVSRFFNWIAEKMSEFEGSGSVGGRPLIIDASDLTVEEKCENKSNTNLDHINNGLTITKYQVDIDRHRDLLPVEANSHSQDRKSPKSFGYDDDKYFDFENQVGGGVGGQSRNDEDEEDSSSSSSLQYMHSSGRLDFKIFIAMFILKFLVD